MKGQRNSGKILQASRGDSANIIRSDLTHNRIPKVAENLQVVVILRVRFLVCILQGFWVSRAFSLGLHETTNGLLMVFGIMGESECDMRISLRTPSQRLHALYNDP